MTTLGNDLKFEKGEGGGIESPGKGARNGFAPVLMMRIFAVVFVAAVSTMMLLSWLRESYSFATDLLDGFLVTLLIAVPLYYLVFRPTAELTARTAAAERLRGVLDALPVAARLSRGGRVVYANAACATLFGYAEAGEMVGTDPSAYIAEEDLPRVREYAERRAAGQPGPAQYEMHGKHRDGSSFPLGVFATGLEYEGQRASLLVLTDLRERKRLRLLESVLPICSVCKKVRDDSGTAHGKGAWQSLDKFVARHSESSLSHTYCPECYRAFCLQHGLPVDET